MNRKGFTLIETIASILLICIMSLVIVKNYQLIMEDVVSINNKGNIARIGNIIDMDLTENSKETPRSYSLQRGKLFDLEDNEEISFNGKLICNGNIEVDELGKIDSKNVSCEKIKLRR